MTPSTRASVQRRAAVKSPAAGGPDPDQSSDSSSAEDDDHRRDSLEGSERSAPTPSRGRNPVPSRTPMNPYTGKRPTTDWVEIFMYKLKMASKDAPERFPDYVPFPVVRSLMEDCFKLLKRQRSFGCATVADVACKEHRTGTRTKLPTVTVVGDTHGHFHDFLRLLDLAGSPSEESYFIFNGDFVDRGSWGLEVLLTVLAWKVALPDEVTVVRGNHESEYCTTAYGFRNEIHSKYPEAEASALYTRCLNLFANLPLAAVVDHSVLVVHGGLFRKPAGKAASRQQKRQRKAEDAQGSDSLQVGNMQDLRNANSGGLDPDGQGNSQLASDVLWSDPCQEPGMRENHGRGIGLEFGPNITQQFLEENGLQLVVRSHEGPDAREKRPEMNSIHTGYSEDHVVPAGKLVTLFSAPDYPMFARRSGECAPNDAAFMVLHPPHYAADPKVTTFSSAKRPSATQFYSDADSKDEDDDHDAGEPATDE